MNGGGDTQGLGACLVTGAAGFLGRNLVRRLLEEGLQVRALINSTPLDIQHERLHVVRADISDREQLGSVCEGIDTVFHAASLIALLGGPFASKAYTAQAEAINVTGTENLLRAAREAGCTRFIYTSSVDVCFAGKPLPKMDESLPYPTRFKSVYARTKAEAERSVLAANGEGGLYTCAIRPDGIWGAETNDMIDRIAKQIRRGQMSRRIGDPGTLQDNSHVLNLVHAHLLAAAHLHDGGVAGGKAYFISDDAPQNSIAFFRPLIEGLGQPMPEKQLSTTMLRMVAHLMQAAHFLFGAAKPPLCPHELDKVTVTHYAVNTRAERELGYSPVISYAEGMEQCLQYVLEQDAG